MIHLRTGHPQRAGWSTGVYANSIQPPAEAGPIRSGLKKSSIGSADSSSSNVSSTSRANLLLSLNLSVNSVHRVIPSKMQAIYLRAQELIFAPKPPHPFLRLKLTNDTGDGEQHDTPPSAIHGISIS